MSKTLLLPRWSKQSSPCSLCRCTKHGPLSYLDNRLPDPTKNIEGAPWLGTWWTFDEWKNWDGRSACPLFLLAWLSACNVALDWMHVKYLRADQYLYGGCVYLLVFNILPGTPKANLQVLWCWMKQYYKQHKPLVRYRQFNKMTMFLKKRDFPKLRGKAAEVKAFGKVLQEMWVHFMDKGDDQHKKIRFLLKNNIELDNILAEFPVTDGHYRFPEAGYRRFVSACFKVAQTTKALNEFYAGQDTRVFNVTSKAHCMLHVALLAKYLHPALVWCYKGEDYMRVVQTLLQSCVRGNNPFQAMNKATRHYMLGSQLAWDKDAEL